MKECEEIPQPKEDLAKRKMIEEEDIRPHAPSNSGLMRTHGPHLQKWRERKS
jgi:hypothetical protein